MYETYPKKSNSSYGEQHSTKFAPDGASPEYQQVGSKTSYGAKGHKGPNSRMKSNEHTRKPFINGGGNKQVSLNPANRTHAKLPTETAMGNKLISPTSRAPKAR